MTKATNKAVMNSVDVKFSWALFGGALGSGIGCCVGEGEGVMIRFTVEVGDGFGE